MARKIFPNDTPSGTVSAIDLLMFADVSDASGLKSATISAILLAGLAALTTDNLPEGSTNKYYSDLLVSANPDVLNATNDRHSHPNKALLDTYDQTNADIQDAISLEHTHPNQSALDAITNSGTGTTFLSDNGTYIAISGGDASSAKQIVLTSQTVDTGVLDGYPVYFDSFASKWKKAIGADNVPSGVVESTTTGRIVLAGRCTCQGIFEPGVTYFYNSTSGGLTKTSTAYKVGFALNANELYVDIDAESTTSTGQRFVGDAGYSLGGATLSTSVLRLRFDIELPTFDIATVASGGSGDGNNGFNSSLKGYYKASGVNTTVIGFTFASGTAATLSATINQTRNGVTGLNSATRGYFCGGYNNSTTYYNNYDVFDFATETRINAVTLGVARRSPAGVQSSTVGLLLGGTQTGGTATTEIDGINFSNDTLNNPASVLSGAGVYKHGFNSSTHGYVQGATTSNDKISLSDYTVSALSAIPTSHSGACGTNSGTAGYAIGNGSSTNIMRTLFSNDAVSNITATMSSQNGSPLAGFQSGGFL